MNAFSIVWPAVSPCNTTVENGTISLPPQLPKGLCVITLKRNATAALNYTALHVATLNLKLTDRLLIYDGNRSVAGNIVVDFTGMRGLSLLCLDPFPLHSVSIRP